MNNYNPIKINGYFNLLCTDDIVIAYGNGIYVYRDTGELIFSRKDLKNVFKIAVLPDNRIVVECCKQKKFVILSLTTGEDIAQIPIPRRDYSSYNFALSNDGLFLYEYFFLNLQCYITRIQLDLYQIDFWELHPGLRSTSDIICDENDILCILQSNYEVIADNELSINGVRYEYFDACRGIGSAYYWKEKWIFPAPQFSSRFLNDTNTILTNDLCIYHVNTKEIERLINEDEIPESNFFSFRSVEDKYLIITYSDSNIVIERDSKKIIARYFAELTHGCVVGDQFWICCDGGIQRKPFPLIEGV